ncbi:MAG: orotate phosphoribosyltransferase [Actinomycetota bacterium]|jgi:orotate phosphoribosyltransferase|nr:orotate phosphoribosyltransferase [Actinomycetota bacterium]
MHNDRFASLTQKEVHDSLVQAGAILSGHFVLTSGRHSDKYVQCARVLEDSVLTTKLAQAAVAALPEQRIDRVASPAVGGIIIGFAVAQALGVKFIFTEREQGVMTLRRSFDVPAGSRVLVVEDVVTTGGSVREVIDLIEAAEAEAVGVVSIIDRGGDKKFDVELQSLLRLEVESWEPASCMQCSSGVPVDSPGSRRLAVK